MDESDRQVLYTILAGLAQDVGFRLRSYGLKARTVGISATRFLDSAGREPALPVNADAEIYGCAKGCSTAYPFTDLSGSWA